MKMSMLGRTIQRGRETTEDANVGNHDCRNLKKGLCVEREAEADSRLFLLDFFFFIFDTRSFGSSTSCTEVSILNSVYIKFCIFLSVVLFKLFVKKTGQRSLIIVCSF